MPGLDRTVINQIDFDKAIKRIIADLRTDFIFAPHLNTIYNYAASDLISLLKDKLSDGTFQFNLPIMLNIPKPSHLSRPGSILLPFDRLVYQALIDLIAPKIESAIDRNHVFSNVYQDSNDNMFEKFGESYRRFQSFISQSVENYNYCLKTDVASYFDTINQHVLINLLRALQITAPTVRFLEQALLAWREQNSYGIVQGVFGSDLLGNYYLTNLDYYLKIHGYHYCRFVDDIFVFHDNQNDLKKLLIVICDTLRKQGLFLNENKTQIKESTQILRQETEFDTLFREINDMIEQAFADDSPFFATGYGFQTNWDEPILQPGVPYYTDYTEVEGFNLGAIKELYAKRDEARWQRDAIVKFCLPLLTKVLSDYPMDTIKDEIINNAHLVKYYCNYLSTIDRTNPDITAMIESILLTDNWIYDYQILWLFSALLYREGISNSLINKAVRIFMDKRNHVTIRAICAILVLKLGSGTQKRTLRDGYQSEPSIYVKSAILFGTQYLSSEERLACRGAWGGHSELNSLIIKAQKNRLRTQTS